MDAFFLKLCWKNLWRNKRRTFLTVNAIAFAVMALTWVFNYYDAFHEQLIANAIRYQNGHLVISAPGFLDRKTPSKFVSNVKAVEQVLKKQPHVRSFSSRIIVQGLVSSPYGSSNVLIQGINPLTERKTTHFSQNMVGGRFFEPKALSGQERGPKKHPIVLGKGVAEVLKAKVGSKLVALTQGIDGSIGNELFYVVGIFETHSDMDKAFVFTLIEDARALLSLPPGAVHQISAVLIQERTMPQVKEELSRHPALKTLQITTWKEMQRNLMALVELDKSANQILMIVILLVASLGMANSILMGIMERTREFGVMAAMGTDKRDMIRLVIGETLLMSAVGTFLGCCFGIALTLYFQKHGFDLKWLTSQEIKVNGAIIQTVSYPRVHWLNIFIVSFTVIFLSFLAAIIPARYVTKLKVLEALRH